jgi:hypothetical protein
MTYALLRYSQHLSQMRWDQIDNEYLSSREILGKSQTNIVFSDEFLTKSIANLSFSVSTYSEISHIIIMVKNTIYNFYAI